MMKRLPALGSALRGRDASRRRVLCRAGPRHFERRDGTFDLVPQGMIMRIVGGALAHGRPTVFATACGSRTVMRPGLFMWPAITAASSPHPQ